MATSFVPSPADRPNISRHSRTALGVVAALLVASCRPSFAADASDPAGIDTGIAEYRRGEFENAWLHFWALAAQGNAAAQFNLAQMYRLGQGIPADPALARHWYIAAADQGHGYAQYNLGLMYEFGHGTAPDLARARLWYRRAADQNIAAARTALERLETHGSDAR
jgi:TPR repeat protein